MNKVFLIGRLTQDPQASSFESGHSYCRFSIAVNRAYSRDGENKADSSTSSLGTHLRKIVSSTL